MRSLDSLDSQDWDVHGTCRSSLIPSRVLPRWRATLRAGGRWRATLRAGEALDVVIDAFIVSLTDVGMLLLQGMSD